MCRACLNCELCFEFPGSDIAEGVISFFGAPPNVSLFAYNDYGSIQAMVQLEFFTVTDSQWPLANMSQCVDILHCHNGPWPSKEDIAFSLLVAHTTLLLVFLLPQLAGALISDQHNLAKLIFIPCLSPLFQCRAHSTER